VTAKFVLGADICS